MSNNGKGPFRADHVGSLLRPGMLLQARAQRARKNITAGQLREIEDAAIRDVVKLQEDAGMHGVTDGELRRDYWHLDFLTQIGGVEFEEGNLPLHWHRHDGVELTWVPPEVKVHARLSHPKPIQVADFEFLKSVTSRTAKVCIPSPSMMIVQGGEKIIDRAVYPDPDKFFDDLARVYAEEIAALGQAGCTYLQLDDTFLAFLCDEKIGAAFGRSNEDTKKMARISARLINESIKNRPSNMAICIHLCRGNYQSSWLSEGGYDPVAEILLGEIKVDGFFLEYDDERSGGFAPLRFLPKGKQKDSARPRHIQDTASRSQRPAQAPYRRGRKAGPARTARDLSAMRFWLDRRRQLDDGRSGSSEAAALRRSGDGGLGRRCEISAIVSTNDKKQKSTRRKSWTEEHS